jgi:Tfp pilus assembly protein PilX
MMKSTRSNEQGVALVFTLFLMASLSALAVSLMFLAQTETSSTRNYRAMSQARYAGEAGVHKAANYLINSYTPPGSFTNYNLTVSPVTCTSGCATTGPVVLSGLAGVSSNYPDSTVQSNFSAAVQGTLAAGTGSVTYAASAKLMSMRQVKAYGGGSGVVQVWEITADGTVPGALPATVEVVATLERQMGNAQTFAVYATGTQCAAISFSGTVSTASYDSTVAGSSSSPAASGGNVGTNGNMTISGHVDVHGSLSSPRAGVGACVNGSGVTALTQSGAATVDNNNVIQLPQPLNFTTPALPSPMPPTVNQTTCTDFALVLPATCTTVSGTTTIDPMGTTVSLGNISGNLVLNGGSYSINSIGTGNISVGTSGMGANSTVVINIGGKTSAGADLANVFNLNGQAIVNSSMDPSKFQIIYAGPAAIDMTGGSNAAFMLYAPNASVTTHGNSIIYGSVLANTVTSAGTPQFVYDRHLNNTFFTLGNFVMSSFSWKKY